MKINQEALQDFFLDNQNLFSPETIRSYRLSLRQFFSSCPKDLTEVKAKDIRKWLEELNNAELKATSIQIKLAAVKSFYEYCTEENLIHKNPTVTVKTPQKEDSLPYYLTRRQLALLRELTKTSLRDRAIVETLYATGVRISELLQIRLEDIKWDTRQILIRKGKGNRARPVLFTYECAERLKIYLERQNVNSQFLFPNSKGQPISRQLVQKLFRGYSDVLGFKVTPHTLRHTFASHLAEKGMDFTSIQELLGHANINSTRIYTRLMNNERKKLYDQYQL